MTVANLKRTVPTLRIHKASSQYVADLNGQTRYFGKDEEAAWAAFLPALAEWRASSGLYDSVTVREAAEALAGMVAADCGHASLRLARAPLKAFTAKYGARCIDSITVHDIETFKSDCQKTCAPKTVNHWLGSAKRLMKYAAYKGWRPPMELSFVRMVALAAPPPKHLTIAEVSAWMDKADAHCANLGVWLRIMLATGARPSEVVRLVKGEGSWLEDGVFVFDKAKTNKAVRHPRCLVLQPEMLALLKTATPQWRWQCTFAQACHAAFESGPHRLRHTSGYLIHRLPGDAVSRETVDLLLGHYPGWVSLTYNPVDWRPIKALAGRYLRHLQGSLPRAYPLA